MQLDLANQEKNKRKKRKLWQPSRFVVSKRSDAYDALMRSKGLS